MLGEREFTSEEVAQLCGVSRPAVVEWVTRGHLPARLTEGGHRRIGQIGLVAFLQAQGYAIPRTLARTAPLLVVLDDEAIWRTTLAADLARDFEVATFAPGADVLLALGAQVPDVLVVDLHMPGLSGRQVLAATASSPVLTSMLRVALTTFPEEVAGARRSGAEIALPKSEASRLRETLVHALTERQRRRTAAA